MTNHERAAPPAQRGGDTEPDRTEASAGGIFSWCLYDWAHSAFGTIVTTFIFAPYFIRAVAPSVTEGTVMWGRTVSLVALIAAIAAPVLGSIADRAGRRKPWIGLFTATSAIFVCGLFFVEPTTEDIWLALTLFGVAAIATDLAWVFYNAMLPTLVSGVRLGRVSGWAWSLGYLGGMGSLVIALFGFVRDGAPMRVLDTGLLEHIRATPVLAGVWIMVFSLPLLLITPDRPRQITSAGAAIRGGVRSLLDTLRHARQHRNLALFLLSWLFAANGFTTLFAFAGIYAAGTFDMSLEEITLFAICVNITAGLGAAAFGWVDDRIGPKRTILIALAALTALGLVLVLTDSKSVLWTAGLILGCFVGPAQSANRSFMARLAPPEREAQMFGLYGLSGKATAFAGPLILAIATDLFDSQRAGMASILVFFVLAMATLLVVEEPR